MFERKPLSVPLAGTLSSRFEPARSLDKIGIEHDESRPDPATGLYLGACNSSKGSNNQEATASKTISMGMEKASSPLGLTSVPEHDAHCPPGVTFRWKDPSIGVPE